MRSAPKKELKTDEEPVACDICGRTILKGERTEPFLAPGGRRRTVCELCIPRADHEGWIRESAQNDLPATRVRPQQRRSFVGRLRGMFDGDEPARFRGPPRGLLRGRGACPGAAGGGGPPSMGGGATTGARTRAEADPC